MFRDQLLSRYESCCLCGVDSREFLVASHIKPWSLSSNVEKLDINNGLLLCPNHDSLFDKGFISFQNTGEIVISGSLDSTNRTFLNVHEDMKIKTNKEIIRYLKFHRDKIFKDK